MNRKVIIVGEGMAPTLTQALIDASDGRMRPLRHLEKVLMCRMHRDPPGQPLKTALANKFPLLSRRQRRELMRAAIKAQVKLQKTAEKAG
jgi:hypothetical protein